MKTLKSLRVLALMALAYNQAFTASSQLTGSITFTLNKVPNPNADQADAYAKIKIAMDSAIGYYNTYTTITKKLTVDYDVSVNTADANYDGHIRFGKNRNYMLGCTAMHEIGHTVGVGTTTEWSSLMKNGVYTGVNGTNKLRELTGDPKAIVNGDSKPPLQHFWPYGLNYASEVKSKTDLIFHCLIVNAMMRDLFPKQYPTPITADASDVPGSKEAVSLISGATVSYNLPVPCFVALAFYTPSGQKVFNVALGTMEAGGHTTKVNAYGLSQGLYIYRFQAGRHKESGSFTIGR